MANNLRDRRKIAGEEFQNAVKRLDAKLYFIVIKVCYNKKTVKKLELFIKADEKRTIFFKG